MDQLHGLAQGSGNNSTSTVELLQSFTKPSIHDFMKAAAGYALKDI